MTRTMRNLRSARSTALVVALALSASAKAASDLQPSIQTPASSTLIGGPQVYSLSLHNHGPDVSASASITFNPPAGGIVLDAHGEYWQCERSLSQATCHFQTSLPSGAFNTPAQVLVLAPTVAGQGWASASSDYPDDGNAANNGAAQMTPIIAAPNAPDLAVSIHAEDVVEGGQPLAFDLGVENVGGHATSGALILRSRLPDSFVPVSAQGDGWNCSTSQALVQCTFINPLAPGESAADVHVVADASGLASPVQLVASVSGDSDVATANNITTASVAVLTPPMELSAWVDQSPAFVGVNDEFGYSVAVRNSGAAAMPGPVKLTVALSGADIIATSTIGGWTCDLPDAGFAECMRSALGSGEVAVLNLAAKAPGTKGTATLSVTVEPTAGIDPIPGNNSDVVDTAIEAPDLSVAMSATPVQILIGESISLKIDVANLAAIPAEDAPIVATAALPAGLAFDSVAAPGWSCSPVGANVECTRASLAAQTQAGSIGIVVIGATAGTFQPAASVSHAFDFNPGNDSVLKTVRVSVPANSAPGVPAGQQFSVAEDASPPENVGLVAATDVDGDILQFSLPQGAQLPFAIDSATGLISVDGPLDFEAVPSYEVEVEVSDGQSATLVTVSIEVIDVGGSDDQTFAPVLPAGQAFVVAENAAQGATFGAVLASDADVEDALAFTMPGAAALPFAIDAASGVLRVDGPLDFEATPSYAVDIEVSDGTSVAAAVVTITVADIGGPDDSNDAPVIPAGQSFSVSENAAPGTPLGTLQATDPDPADVLSYSLVGDAVLPFTISAATGNVSVDGPIDFESTSVYGGLIVQVSDGTVSVQQGFSISVTDVGGSNDINEPPAIGPNQVFEISEDAVPGSLVGTLTATDPDSNDTLAFEFVSPAGLPFAMDADTGAISVAAELDFETAPQFAGVAVRVHDGTTFATGTITLRVLDVGGANDVNDAPQIAAGQVFHVNESAVGGTSLGIVQASDPDPGDSLAFTLLGDAFLPFTVEAGTGELLVDGPLDFESTPFYSGLLVQADDGLATTTQSIAVHVGDFGGADDINVAPVVAAGQEFTVMEDAPAGAVVGIVQATDADGDAITLGFAAPAGLPFAIDAATGVISVAGALNSPSYDNLQVAASDGWSTGVGAIRIVVQPGQNGGTEPVATDDLYFAPADAPLVVAAPGVLGNDSDPDAAGLLAELVGAPSHPGAIVELQPDGGFEFTPPPGLTDVTVTFEYRVSDASSDDDTGLVTVQVNSGRVFRNGFEN